MIDEILKDVEQYKTKNIVKKYIVNSSFLKIDNSDYVLNNNKTINRDLIIKPCTKAVMVAPKTKDNKYIVVMQPRVATKLGVTIEFPAGLVDNDEDIYTAIKRELKEETGYVSDDITFIREYYQDTATCSASISIAVANNCIKVSNQNLDNDEFISYYELSFDEILKLVDLGLICDGNTLYCIEIIKQQKKS